MQHKTGFCVEVLVDFLDDAAWADHVLSDRDVDGLMRTLAEAGVRRVVWAYYGDGHGGLICPGFKDGTCDWANVTATYRRLGNPLREAVQAGHRHGLEVHAYYKPYETGVSLVLPDGSPEAKAFGRVPHRGGQLGVLDPFVAAHPELRIQRRADDLPAGKVNGPICALRLAKRNAAPTRVTGEHLQMWISADNTHYQPLAAPFTVTEAILPAARDVHDHTGALVTPRGTPQRVLTLSGFAIDAPYVLVTTDFAAGPGDFEHSGTAMLTALDGAGQEIPGEFATGGGVWLAARVDFRQWGLIFDFGFGRGVTRLDEPNTTGRSGFIAFARGKNAYLPAALCETEPAGRAYWLQCVEEMIAAGVDGIDIREENHCTHTDEPEAYGFNAVVLAQCRPGCDLRAEVARVRGEAYTAFLREVSRRLAVHGKPLRYHLNMDWFRPDPPAVRALAYPANLEFQWERWVKEGILGAAVLRSYQLRSNMLSDAFGARMVAACRERQLPVSFNHHIFADEASYLEEARRVARDGRFAGIILYEAQSFLRTGADGSCRFTLDVAKEICAELGAGTVGSRPA